MVLERLMLLMYVPLAVGGFRRTTVVRNAWMFSDQLLGLEIRLADRAWTMPALSTRNSILPAFTSLTALATSGVTVPLLGFGIRPRGPSTLPELADLAHDVGRGDDDVDVGPPALDLLDVLREARVVGPGRPGFLVLRRPGQHQHADLLADAVRAATTVPRIAWSAFLGSTPRRTAMSTDSANFAVAVSFTSATASSIVYSLFWSTFGVDGLESLAHLS